jgi:hypothetical protein
MLDNKPPTKEERIERAAQYLEEEIRKLLRDTGLQNENSIALLGTLEKFRNEAETLRSNSKQLRELADTYFAEFKEEFGTRIESQINRKKD